MALWAGKELFSQVWLFWLAPIVGAVSSGFTYHALFAEPPITEQNQIEALTDRDFDRSKLEEESSVR